MLFFWEKVVRQQNFLCGVFRCKIKYEDGWIGLPSHRTLTFIQQKEHSAAATETKIRLVLCARLLSCTIFCRFRMKRQPKRPTTTHKPKNYLLFIKIKKRGASSACQYTYLCKVSNAKLPNPKNIKITPHRTQSNGKIKIESDRMGFVQNGKCCMRVGVCTRIA